MYKIVEMYFVQNVNLNLCVLNFQLYFNTSSFLLKPLLKNFFTSTYIYVYASKECAV